MARDASAAAAQGRTHEPRLGTRKCHSYVTGVVLGTWNMEHKVIYIYILYISYKVITHENG